MTIKPRVQLSGANGNTLNLLSLCTRALKRNNQQELAIELRNKVFECESYDVALQIIMEYVDVQ